MCNKVCFCEKVGFEFFLVCFFVDILEEEVFKVVYNLNEDDVVDGFIV